MSSYSSASNYINSAKDLYDRIKKIDEIINALLSIVIESSNEYVKKYMLNDGQTIIKTRYRSMEEIRIDIDKFEMTKQMCVKSFNHYIYKKNV